MSTPGATRAAQIIMAGKYTIPTLFGIKKSEGIADLIDRATGAWELLEALKDAVCHISSRNFGEDAPGLTAWEDDFVRRAHAIITEAEGGTDHVSINRP